MDKTIEVEADVIGSLIQNPGQFNEVAEVISEKDFKIDLYRHAFITIKRLIESGEGVDITKLYYELNRPGSASSLSESMEAFLAPSYYAQILRKRNIEEEIRESVKERQYQETQKRLKELQVLGKPTDLYSIQKMIETNENFKEYYQTGFRDLDHYLKLYPSDLMVIAGRPSIGKSSFGLSILCNLAKTIPVGLVSFEMGMNKIGKRLATMYLFDELNQISKNFIASSPSSFTLSETRKSIYSFIDKIGVKVIMVDYLQLMQDTGRHESRRLEVTNLIRGLKELAKEFGIVMIVISSLSRGGDHSEMSRPTMSMLRESGDIEYCADCIVFLNKPKGDDKTELILDKNRDGKSKKIINLIWLEDHVRYGDYEWRKDYQDKED